MQHPVLLSLLFAAPYCLAQAQGQGEEAKIQNAVSAAPPSISADATVMDWPTQPGGEMQVLREGSNDWTCMPDNPESQGNDPMCLDAQWMQWADAWMNRTEPNVTAIGFGYMLAGAAQESNTDPYAEGPTADNEWIDEPVPHLMILVPDEQMLSDMTTDWQNGGPWVMWRDTPYVHIMAPMPAYDPEQARELTGR